MVLTLRCLILVVLLGFEAEQHGGARNGEETWSTVQAKPLLNADLPLRELRAFVAARIPKMPRIESVKDWETKAQAVRTGVLEKIVFRGEAVRWRDAKTHVEWLDTLKGGSDYVIRKFRYEALPGMWFPGLLYEPKVLADKVPVFINVNGHDPLGKATPQTQMRCINLAKRGCLAYLLEFLNMGQLQGDGNRHDALLQIDLCGTSGIAPFYLCLTRGLDVALAHPHADASRVGVAGLSGGGWQTIMLASLDKRITLANPVAGYASMLTRTQYTRDVGDAEQIPSDLCTLADYTHLTALMAPRPLLLTYNAKDECCFLPEGTLPTLEEAARPIYNLYGRAGRFQTHVNQLPGTHNFERDNREAFYRLVGDVFFPGDAVFNRKDDPVAVTELKSAAQLFVPLPADNATLHTLAVAISRTLPEQAAMSREAEATNAWRQNARQRLSDVIRLENYDAQMKPVDSADVDGVKVTRSLASFGNDWTLPVVELSPPNIRATAIVFGDNGREALNPTVTRLLETGHCVFLVDLLGFGEANNDVQPIEWQMIATVGRRLLGIQVGQLAALAKMVHARVGRPPVKLVAVGPRASVIALVAVAVDPAAFNGVQREGSWKSLKEFINRNLELKDAPELGCFGLLKEFDIPQLEALVGPRSVLKN